MTLEYLNALLVRLPKVKQIQTQIGKMILYEGELKPLTGIFLDDECYLVLSALLAYRHKIEEVDAEAVAITGELLMKIQAETTKAQDENL